ncbi:MAG: hypothetical protein PEGG_00572 [Paraeggerthella hongkongensis]
MTASYTMLHVFAPNEAVHFLGDYHEILEGDCHAYARS